MYIATLKNGEVTTEIHGYKEKLKSGTISKGINAIDSFTFSILPSNDGFDKINEMKTLVSVFNERRNRYEFQGRVLKSPDEMTESGLIYKEVVCESLFGFFNDSIQTYVEEQNWTVNGLLMHIVYVHNSKVEPHKRFEIGEVTVTDPNDNLYCGIQREKTWKTLNDKLINVLGGEIRFRVVDDVTYIDYLKEIGTHKATKIEVARNMKKISREKDASAYITRLTPLGNKLKIEQTKTDEDGNTTTEIIETEERLDISSVNDGLTYIDDVQGMERFGIIEGVQMWDDVSTASALFSKGEDWLANNNKMLVKYSITALDLSILGLDIDDFDVHNWHPLFNPLLGIDDEARIIKKSIDIVNESPASSIEVGDNFKTLTELQVEQAGKVNEVVNAVGNIVKDYVTNERLISESNNISSLIKQTSEAIMLGVEEVYTKKTTLSEFQKTVSTELGVLSGEIVANFTTTTQRIDGVESEYEQVKKIIRLSGEDGIVLGGGELGYTLQLDNDDGIVFCKNGVPFGTWDGVNFYTGNIVVRVNERAQFGIFAFIPRSDSSLMFTKVGG